MKIFKCTFLTLLWICTHCFAQTVSNCPEILQYAEHKLQHCGVLKMTDRFVYVDLDDAYIHSLLPFIQEEGFEEPPYFNIPNGAGAHISVVYPEEMQKYKLNKIAECGKTIYFTLKTCKVVHPSTWKEVDEVYVIVVEAPELEKIRKKYGLPKQTYEFHITIGIKPKHIQAA